MWILLIGLLLFIGPHANRIFMEERRRHFMAQRGEQAWKGIVSVLSLAGLVLIVWGYGMSRADPVFVWNPPLWTRHLALLLNLVAIILVTAAYVPRNHLKAAIGHPMYVGVKTWALAHLIANGRLGDIILFGVFLAWAVAGFAAARKRDRRAGVSHAAGTAAGSAGAAIIGALIWALITFYLHRLVIGVPPLAV